MAPRAFVSCYICKRDFGLQSITFHEPKCLSKWRAENSCLPPESKCLTPIKMEDNDTISNDSVWTCIRCYNIFPASKRGEHVATCSLPKIERPKTRTLNRANPPPNGLSLVHPSKQASDRLLRPQTKTLHRPTPNMDHPVIESARKAHVDLKTNIPCCLGSNIKAGAETKDKQTIKQPNVLSENKEITDKKGDSKRKQGVGFPPPCKSCQKSDAPERFHSHHRGNCPANKKMAAGKSSQSDSESSSSGSAKKVLQVPTVNGFKKEERLSPVRGPPPPAAPPQIQPVKNASNNNNPATSTITSEKVSQRIPQRIVTVPVKSGPISSVTTEDNQRNQSSKRPRIVVCYLCGRDFGTRSYPFHEPHCIERWRRDNQALPPDLRRSMPQRPTSGEGFSEHAWETFQAQLIPCPTCGRTFFPNRLPIHQKACKGPEKGSNGGGSPSSGHVLPQVNQEENEHQKRSVFKPSLTACYICARQFGSMSLSLHEPQCLKKWRIENERLSSHMRRPEPQKPPAVFKEDGTLDTVAMEAATWKTHVVTLPRCVKCGRTFFPDRLAIHEPNCKALPLENNKIPVKLALSA